MEIKITCPLGSECERIANGHIERCAWYVEIQGTDPQSGKEVRESKCAMAWQPILAIEGNGVNNQVAASIQSLRNETVKRQNLALESINATVLANQ